jgi:mannobiose 2-epimerase
VGTSSDSAYSGPGRLDARTTGALADELETALRELLEAWFPRCVDQEYGGFLCDFDHRWRPSGDQLKMLEFQARTTRAVARAAAFPGFEGLREMAAHGWKYLRDVMWDHESGGWFRMLDRAGNPLEGRSKHGHGTSYAIGACAAYYALTSDPEALDLAKRAFTWVDDRAHDDAHGGYFVFYTEQGEPITSVDESPLTGPRDGMSIPVGLKDLNTTADLMESFADLHEISPDAVLKARLQELFHIVRDRAVVAPGLVHYYFQPDWTPVPDLYRCAYALNTANLLVRAERALDPEPETAQVVKSLADMALRFAWDNSQGGFIFAGSPFGPTWVGDIKLFVGEKIWWPQAEAMRAILRLGLLHPDDDMRYLRRFDDLWTYIKQYLIDPRNGGWSFVGRDSKPLRKQPKATMWKDLSHESHALMGCLQMLRD